MSKNDPRVIIGEHLADIPKDIRSIFYPRSEKGMDEYAKRITEWNEGKKERDELYTLYLAYKHILPLRARKSWSPRRVEVALHVAAVKEQNGYVDKYDEL